MKLKYDAPLRTRIKKGGYKTKDVHKYRNFMHASIDDHSLLFPQRIWVKNEDIEKHEFEWRSSSCACFSEKAFKRLIRKNKFPKGKCYLVSRFRGYDIYY